MQNIRDGANIIHSNALTNIPTDGELRLIITHLGFGRVNIAYYNEKGNDYNPTWAMKPKCIYCEHAPLILKQLRWLSGIDKRYLLLRPYCSQNIRYTYGRNRNLYYLATRAKNATPDLRKVICDIRATNLSILNLWI